MSRVGIQLSTTSTILYLQQTIYLNVNASNCKVDNVNFQFGSREDATGQTNCGAIRLANCNGNVVTNVEQIKAGPIYPYGNALLCASRHSKQHHCKCRAEIRCVGVRKQPLELRS